MARTPTTSLPVRQSGVSGVANANAPRSPLKVMATGPSAAATVMPMLLRVGRALKAQRMTSPASRSTVAARAFRSMTLPLSLSPLQLTAVTFQPALRPSFTR